VTGNSVHLYSEGALFESQRGTRVFVVQILRGFLWRFQTNVRIVPRSHNDLSSYLATSVYWWRRQIYLPQFPPHKKHKIQHRETTPVYSNHHTKHIINTQRMRTMQSVYCYWSTRYENLAKCLEDWNVNRRTLHKISLHFATVKTHEIIIIDFMQVRSPPHSIA
jgi:hypothetical protein